MRYTREEMLIDGGRKLYLYTFEDEATGGDAESHKAEEVEEPPSEELVEG